MARNDDRQRGTAGINASRAASEGLRRAGIGAGRIGRAWRGLPSERRLAAGAALALFVTLFLPWYQETVIASGKTPALQSASASLTGWGAFSFVEAAVLLVAVGVLGLLFARAEGRAFHVPGGDGGVITAAGLWTVALIVWRMFDKEGTTGHGQYATTSGIEWGIFVALGVAGALVYAGQRIRAAHEPEPPLPGERLGPAPRRGAPDARSATAPTPPTAPTTPGEPGPYVRKRPRFDVGPSGSHGSRPDSSRPDSPPPATPPPETPAAGQKESEIRPHRPRVSRDDAARRGLNFSDLDDIQFDAPPEPPGRIPRSPDPSIDPSPGRHTGPGEPPEGSEPPTIRRRSASGPPDDQLTIRLDGQE